MFFKTLFLILLIIFSGIHLFHSWKDDEKHRKFTKPFLIPLIAGFYFCSSQTILWTFVASLFFSWLGDIFLMIKRNKTVAIGGVSFLLSHIFFVITYLPNIQFSSINYIYILFASVVYILLIIFISRHIEKTIPSIFKFPISLYLAINATMNIFALMQFISLKTSSSLLIYLGAAIFFISDLTCITVRFSDLKNFIFKKHFTVMITYIISFVLITLGMIN